MGIAHRNVSTSMPCVPIFLQFFPCRPYTWRDFSTSPELTNVVFGTIYPLTVPFSSPFGSFAEKRFVKGENSLNIAGKLGGNVIPKVVLRDETTRDRSAVCFETVWSTVACLRDVWTSYEFAKNFRVLSSSWYESNNSHASRNPKYKDPAFKFTRQWMSSSE